MRKRKYCLLCSCAHVLSGDDGFPVSPPARDLSSGPFFAFLSLYRCSVRKNTRAPKALCSSCVRGWRVPLVRSVLFCRPMPSRRKISALVRSRHFDVIIHTPRLFLILPRTTGSVSKALYAPSCSLYVQKSHERTIALRSFQSSGYMVGVSEIVARALVGLSRVSCLSVSHTAYLQLQGVYAMRVPSICNMLL